MVTDKPLVATLTTPLSETGDELRSLADAGVGVLEIRADLIGEPDPDWLRDRFPGELLYTLRSRAEGGRFEGGRHGRKRRLALAAETYDLVDLEAERDLFPELLADVPKDKRLISWHGPATHLTGLRARFEKLSATEARYYKMIPEALEAGDGIRALALLQSLHRDDVICFASGEMGTWTRLLAIRLGAPFTYAAFGDVPAAPGQLSVEKLCRDYGLPRQREAHHLYGIVGCPVSHSLSPRLYNGAFRALGIEGLYLPFHVESFGDFWLEVVEAGSLEVLGFDLQGLSVTAPYKEVALAVSGASSPQAQHVSAANTLVVSGGVWEASTTDPEGVVGAMRRAGVTLAGRKAVVVGCGGAGRAAAYGLELAGAQVTLANRGEERGRRAAIELHLPFVPARELDPSQFEVLVNATSLGHHEDDALAFDLDRVRPGAAVLDLVYGEQPTRLLREARERGLVGVDGREVLLFQALGQFRLMIGRELDEDLARDLLGMVC